MAHTIQSWSWPDSYIGQAWDGFYSAGFGQSRDSDALEASNFAVASQELLKLQMYVPDADEMDGERQSVQIVRERHWAVGWVEWIAIDKRNIQATQRALELCGRVSDYPVLDDDHWSNLEYERAMEFWDSLSLSGKVDYCRDCRVSIFAARRSHNLPDRLWESLTQ